MGLVVIAIKEKSGQVRIQTHTYEYSHTKKQGCREPEERGYWGEEDLIPITLD